MTDVSIKSFIFLFFGGVIPLMEIFLTHWGIVYWSVTFNLSGRGFSLQSKIFIKFSLFVDAFDGYDGFSTLGHLKTHRKKKESIVFIFGSLGSH